jgi:transcriptional regulator of heat shock response
MILSGTNGLRVLSDVADIGIRQYHREERNFHKAPSNTPLSTVVRSRALAMDIEDRILLHQLQRYFDAVRDAMRLKRQKPLRQSIFLPLDEFLSLFEEDQDEYEQEILLNFLKENEEEEQKVFIQIRRLLETSAETTNQIQLYRQEFFYQINIDE